MEHIYKLCTINQIADIILNPLAVNNKGLFVNPSKTNALDFGLFPSDMNWDNCGGNSFAKLEERVACWYNIRQVASPFGDNGVHIIMKDSELNFGSFLSLYNEDTYCSKYAMLVCALKELVPSEVDNTILFLVRMAECDCSKPVGHWSGTADIPIVQIDGRIVALNGWNGESYLDCWEVKELINGVGFEFVNEKESLTVTPKCLDMSCRDEYGEHDEDFVIVGYAID